MYIKKYILVFLVFIIFFDIQKSMSITNKINDKKNLFIKKKSLLKSNFYDNSPITIQSDKIKGNYFNNLIFYGRVHINQNDNNIYSNKVVFIYNKISNFKTYLKTIDAIGNVYYYNYSNNIILKASKISINFNNKNTDIWNGKYQLVNKRIYGLADKIYLRDNNDYIIFKNGCFTSCNNSKKSWNIAGSKIIHDRKKGIVKIWNLRLNVANIPIFYSPYFQFFIDNNRHSGFLFPNIKYSNNNGMELILPYYWNIAAQADATIIPHYINKYGLQLQNEFRLKTNFGSDLLAFDYLLSNKNKTNISFENNKYNFKNRWLFYWKHVGLYKKHWVINTNITKISDNLYFKNFNFNYGNVNKDYIDNKINIGFVDNNLNFYLSFKNFKNLNDNEYVRYFIYPQIDFNLYFHNFKYLTTHFYTQLINFKTFNNHYPNAVRIHIQPKFNLIFSHGPIKSNFETKIFLTHYQQNNINYFNNFFALKNKNYLKKSINRIIPQFKIDSCLLLSKKLKLTKKYLQTLEPHLQYLYVPYYNQNNIYPYDSSLLLNNYLGLFYTHKYTGIDFIPHDNKITMSIITKIYDNNLNQIFYFALGQMYSYNELINQKKTNDNKYYIHNIILANDTYWKINNNLEFRSNIEYDNTIGNIVQNNILIKYYLNNKYKIQINYMYNNLKYIKSTFKDINLTDRYNINNINNINLFQIGETMHINFLNNFSIVHSYFYDIKNHKKINQIFGLEYNSSCYSIFFSYERRINFLHNNINKYNNKFALNIKLLGLSNTNNVNKISSMLNQNFIPYQSIF